MKAYAKQVPPERQQSPLDFDFNDCCYEKVIFSGNRNFNSHNTGLLKKAENLGNEICPDGYESIDLLEWCKEMFTKTGDELPWVYDIDVLGPYRTKSLEEYLNAYYSSEKHRAWTAEEAGRFLMAFKGELKAIGGYRSCEKSPEQWRAEQLSILTGEKYETATLRGCCQNDWQTIYYPAKDYDDDFIRMLEIEYFNLGTEWMVNEGTDLVETSEDVVGYLMYVYNDPRKEIAEAEGCSPEDVVLFKFDGYEQIPLYRTV